MNTRVKGRDKCITVLLTLLCLIVLPNCSYLRNRDTTTDNALLPQSSPLTDTKREACVRACSHEHDTCNDGPSSRNDAFDAPKQFVGASAACDQSLRSCLKYCR
jgi:hypothetical protein